MSNFVLTLTNARDNITKLTRETHGRGELTNQQTKLKVKNFQENKKSC